MRIFVDPKLSDALKRKFSAIKKKKKNPQNNKIIKTNKEVLHAKP